MSHRREPGLYAKTADGTRVWVSLALLPEFLAACDRQGDDCTASFKRMREDIRAALKTGHVRPLFIPLRSEYFDAFARGEKNTEYRKHGQRWNAKTCAVGRRVVLSRGYGKQRRLTGTIAGFEYESQPSKLPGWIDCYGINAGPAACITIILDAENEKGQP